VSQAPNPIEDILPLTPLQEGMLFHHVFDEHARDVYTAQMTLDLDGDLDAGALREAARSLLRRQPVLRAGFRHERLSRPAQVIHREVELPWEYVDLSGVEDSQDAEARALRVTADDYARGSTLPGRRWCGSPSSG
jgi:Condensation domain